LAGNNTQKVISFLSEKWGNKECPMCGKGPWQVQDKVFQLSEFLPGRLIGGLMIPVIPVTCTNCGNTQLINAIIAGGIEQKGQSQETKA
jgi:predicted nucleic-acid-binding Zn-ribbon protein